MAGIAAPTRRRRWRLAAALAIALALPAACTAWFFLAQRIPPPSLPRSRRCRCRRHGRSFTRRPSGPSRGRGQTGTTSSMRSPGTSLLSCRTCCDPPGSRSIRPSPRPTGATTARWAREPGNDCPRSNRDLSRERSRRLPVSCTSSPSAGARGPAAPRAPLRLGVAAPGHRRCRRQRRASSRERLEPCSGRDQRGPCDGSHPLVLADAAPLRDGQVAVQHRHERVHRPGQGEGRVPVQGKGLST